ncbi:MAG: response regulator [Chloroflexi bacterium]|nr:response regulator [Chloroflexota bacterium]
MTGKREAVLAVDDDIDLLGMVELVLEDEGHRVVTARDGREALEAVAQEMPRVILLDMKMPGMNGWEFAREFRARYDRRAPIVVLTAAENARERAAEIEADGYLGKPFEIDDLLRTVERYASGGS